MKREARYHVIKSTFEAVWIVDDEGVLSVTNDAERVVAELFRTWGARRIFYRDTDGDWDELQHEGAKFTGFAPARHLAPGTPLTAEKQKPATDREDDSAGIGLVAGIIDGASASPATQADDPPAGGGEFGGAGASGGCDEPSSAPSGGDGET